MMMLTASITKVNIIIPCTKMKKESNNRGESSNRARKWILTMQGTYQKEVLDKFAHEHSSELSYLKIAQEIGEEGKEHLQGYFEMVNKVSLKGVRELWHEPKKGFVPPHLEIAWHPIEAQNYIGNPNFIHENGEKKGGQVVWMYEYGNFVPDKGEARRQGKAWNDSLLEMKQLIDEGKSVYSLYQSHFIQMMYCGKAILAYKELVDSRKRYPELYEHELTSEEEADVIKKAVTDRDTTHFDVTTGAGGYLDDTP